MSGRDEQGCSLVRCSCWDMDEISLEKQYWKLFSGGDFLAWVASEESVDESISNLVGDRMTKKNLVS